MRLRIFRVASIVSALALFALVPLWSQGGNAAGAQQRVAQLRQAIAANKARLMKYTWLQTTTVSVKDETKKEQQMQCHYGADGKVVKTPVGDNPDQDQKKPGGLRGKIATKKIDEMKDYITRTETLISHYVPPDPERMQAELQAGKASVTPAGTVATIVFADYYKPGDQMSVAFDTAAKKIQSYDVHTYLDDPSKDIVTMTNQFASLPDGTNYLQQTVLNMQGKDIKITTTNGGHSVMN